MTRTQRIRALLTILACTFGLTAANAQAPSLKEISGPWDLTVNAMGRDMNMRLLISESPTGEPEIMISSPQGDQRGENARYENGELSWTTRLGPAELDLAVTVKPDNTFAGSATTAFGDVELSGRKLTDAELEEMGAAYDFLVGDWEIRSEYEGTSIESDFRVEIVNGRPMGVLGGGGGPDSGGHLPIDVEGNALRWRVPIPYVTQRGGMVNVTLNEDKTAFTGTMESSLGAVPIEGALVDTSKLVQAVYDDPAPVLGTWDLETEINGQAGVAQMVVSLVEERLQADIMADGLEWTSNSVDYVQVGDTMGRLRMEVDIPELAEQTQTYEFIVDGDTFEGEEIFSDGAILVSGKKVASGEGGMEETAGEGVTAAQVMAMMDRNTDGKIDLDEAPEQLKQSFSLVDSNGDGGIDVTEAALIASFLNNQ